MTPGDDLAALVQPGLDPFGADRVQEVVWRLPMEQVVAAKRWPTYRSGGLAMQNWGGTLRLAIVSGAAGSVASSVALAVLARAEGKGALQPVNSTSHWLNGSDAATRKDADIVHTAVGYATHHVATVLWAVIFERWIGPRRPLSASSMLQDALAMSVIAAVVDYGATPKRFTPGWEFVLSKRSMAAAYAAMALGLAAGALMTQRGRVRACD